MPARVLVTGAAGFFGRHLCNYVRGVEAGVHIVGTDAVSDEQCACDEFVVLDLANEDEVAGLVRRAAPDCVIHLAGTFGTSRALDIYRVNVLGLVALLEAVRVHAPRAVIVAAGSAAEYGFVGADRLPVTEDCPCVPVSAYGQSKLAATQIALMYHRIHGLSATVVRPFQLLGQGVTTRLAPGAFAAQLQQALATGSQVIKVGNLASERDFLDVADAAAGVWALCRQPAPGQTFNLCAGRPTKMSDLLQMMIGVAQADVTIEVDPARLRGAADVSSVYGSFAKLHRHCGWRPQRSLDASVRGMLA
jgi:GDP-4-dehydro-6-deoxy-D-mannose reductase